MKVYKTAVIYLSLLIVLSFAFGMPNAARAEMPFFGLNPQNRVLRAEFSTYYDESSNERKNNISVAAKALDNAFIDVNAEFSFNDRVGVRTEKRGYKNAKIIVKGKFIDGVGGGVCQVSTTLYNAALLSDLKITEHHAHSLTVSYVEPSFDAMVNSGSADLKFVNNTDNPLIIKTKATGEKLTVKIYGEPLKGKITRKSVVKEYVSPIFEKIRDDKHEYNDLYEGEERITYYGKNGIKSEGYILKEINGTYKEKKIRSDFYAPINGTIMIGTKAKDTDLIENINLI